MMVESSHVAWFECKTAEMGLKAVKNLGFKVTFPCSCAGASVQYARFCGRKFQEQ